MGYLPAPAPISAYRSAYYEKELIDKDELSPEKPKAVIPPI
jgi:hypothetical protein